jgi:hypothetical protein
MEGILRCAWVTPFKITKLDFQGNRKKKIAVTLQIISVVLALLALDESLEIGGALSVDQALCSDPLA